MDDNEPRKGAGIRAGSQFRFFTRTTLPLLTGNYAVNLDQLLKGITLSDDSIIYYHTHHYLIQHHYLTPSAPNDFAYWINFRLGESSLAEEISAIDIFDYNSLGEYKAKLINVISNFIKYGKGKRKTRETEINERFNFMKAITFAMDTGKSAFTLQEFHDILKTTSIFSFYYHYFEAHFRINIKTSNDFSMWIRNELKIPELAKKISNLDPYTITMDNLKLNIIKLVEGYL